MDKRQLHHALKGFRAVKPWYFLGAAAVSGAVAVVALRSNNEHMAQLRDNLYQTDKSGGDVQAALNQLHSYVTAHMNTSLGGSNTSVYPPIQLQYTYQRLVQQQGAALQSSNGELYTQAQAYCQAQNSKDFSGRNRVPCIEQYIQAHGVNVSATTVPASLYQYDFIAPKWSPDVAGWSLVITVVLVGCAVAKFVADRWLKADLR